MAVVFPTNPVINETFEAAGLIYTWDGTRWISAFTPGTDYKGPKGNTGATGPVGPPSNEVTVAESDDEDIGFAVLFAQQSVATGVTTIFRDSGGVIFNPATNTFATEIIRTVVVESDINVTEQYVQRFIDGGSVIDGRSVSGVYGNLNIGTELVANPIFATDVDTYAQVNLKLYVQCNATGNIVQQVYTLWRTAAADGFTITNWQNDGYAPQNPIDNIVTDSGVIADPLLGIYFQRNSTSNTIFTVGTFTKLAGSYDLQFKIELDRFSTGSISI